VSKQAIIAQLRAHQNELKAIGFRHLSLFGSVARGQDTAGSDVDLLAELDETNMIDAFAYVGAVERIERILGRHVDLVTSPIRESRLRTTVERDKVDAF
jgi:uncharacterized protein